MRAELINKFSRKAFQLANINFVNETNNSIHNVKKNLWLDKDIIWEYMP